MIFISAVFPRILVGFLLWNLRQIQVRRARFSIVWFVLVIGFFLILMFILRAIAARWALSLMLKQGLVIVAPVTKWMTLAVSFQIKTAPKRDRLHQRAAQEIRSISPMAINTKLNTT
ncbi:hypothetical protein D0Y56_27655 [Pseudomonas aeruginosa]|nr:hypothetical protein D0Y56_27655 [Pseudomonas aeruginosa]KSO02921.1 hypothetical protein APA96_09970 [Pseudomonas aeruginosa]KZE27237.1 hypothetical protein AVT06_23280 [Pseudomonas aeruginosa]